VRPQPSKNAAYRPFKNLITMTASTETENVKSKAKVTHQAFESLVHRGSAPRHVVGAASHQVRPRPIALHDPQRRHGI